MDMQFVFFVISFFAVRWMQVIELHHVDLKLSVEVEAQIMFYMLQMSANNRDSLFLLFLFTNKKHVA